MGMDPAQDKPEALALLLPETTCGNRGNRSRVARRLNPRRHAAGKPFHAFVTGWRGPRLTQVQEKRLGSLWMRSLEFGSFPSPMREMCLYGQI